MIFSSDKKIKGIEEIEKLSKELKQKGLKVVTINGTFDILHIGHIRILKEAKKQGDVLIVGLNSDSSVKSYKGPDRPINSQDDRAEMLAAIGCVDYVVIFDENTPISILEAIKPDIHVNGSEYGEDCIEAPIVKKNGGKIHIVEIVGGYSTTGLINRLCSAKK